MPQGLLLISPARALVVLAGSIAVLLALCVGSRAMIDLVPGDNSQRAFRFLDFDREYNLPSLYSALQLLLASGLAMRVRSATRGTFEAPYWLFVAVIFVAMAADEWFALHERLSEPMRAWLGPEAPFFAWVIPYSLLSGVTALLLLRFWWRQEDPFRWLLALSAALYVAGAIGMELAGSGVFESGQRYTLRYFFITTLEETLELCGVALLVFTLLLRLRRLAGGRVESRIS